MPIVGFGIESISADRAKKIPRGRLNINSTPRIVSIKEAKIGPLKERKGLDVKFEFKTKYEPDIGKINIKGHVFYVGDKAKNGLKSWEKRKKLPKEIDSEIKNFLFRKCLTMGLTLSENMQLPPPLFFPRVMLKKGKKKDLKYIG